MCTHLITWAQNKSQTDQTKRRNKSTQSYSLRIIHIFQSLVKQTEKELDIFYEFNKLTWSYWGGMYKILCWIPTEYNLFKCT